MTSITVLKVAETMSISVRQRSGVYHSHGTATESANVPMERTKNYAIALLISSNVRQADVCRKIRSAME